MKKYEYKPRACRNCGRVFTPKNPLGTRRIGGRPSLYCSEKCRREWRGQYKRDWSKEHYQPRKRRSDHDTIQSLMDLELYDFQIVNLCYDINLGHQGLGTMMKKEDEYLSTEILDKYNLYTNVLESEEWYNLKDLGLKD